MTHRVLALALAIPLAWGGCVRRLPSPPAGPLPDPALLLREIQGRTERIRTLRASARLKVSSPRGRASVKEYISIERPGSVRFETLGLFGPLGGAQSLLVSDGGTLEAYFPGERKGFVGRATPANFGYFVPIPLGPTQMITVLLGSPPALPAEIPLEIRRDEGGYLLAAAIAPDRKVSLWIDPERRVLTRIEIVRDAQEVEFAMTLGDYEDLDGAPFAMSLNLQVPRDLLEVRLHYTGVELNPKLPAEDFRFDFPEGSDVVRLD